MEKKYFQLAGFLAVADTQWTPQAGVSVVEVAASFKAVVRVQMLITVLQQQSMSTAPRWKEQQAHTRYLNNGGALLDNTVEGYPNGSYGRGAPGNAGGGGNDGNPGANDQNSGGSGALMAVQVAVAEIPGLNLAVGGETVPFSLKQCCTCCNGWWRSEVIPMMVQEVLLRVFTSVARPEAASWSLLRKVLERQGYNQCGQGQCQ